MNSPARVLDLVAGKRQRAGRRGQRHQRKPDERGLDPDPVGDQATIGTLDRRAHAKPIISDDTVRRSPAPASGRRSR